MLRVTGRSGDPGRYPPRSEGAQRFLADRGYSGDDPSDVPCVREGRLFTATERSVAICLVAGLEGPRAAQSPHGLRSAASVWACQGPAEGPELDRRAVRVVSDAELPSCSAPEHRAPSRASCRERLRSLSSSGAPMVAAPASNRVMARGPRPAAMCTGQAADGHGRAAPVGPGSAAGGAVLADAKRDEDPQQDHDPADGDQDRFLGRQVVRGEGIGIAPQVAE